MNKCMFAGRLVSDPTIRHTTNNKKVCNFRLAIDRRFKDKDGKWQSDPSFANFEAWDEGALTIMERYKKGSYMLIDDASLKTARWEKKDDDGKVTQIEQLCFRCNHFVLLPLLNPVPKTGEESEPAPEKTDSRKTNSTSVDNTEDGDGGSDQDIPF